MDYTFLLRCFVPALALVVVVLIINLNVMPRFDRDRVRKHIEEHGGKVVEIIQAPGTGYGRGYKVTYMTPGGKQVKAICRTDLNGVYWVSEHPPDLFANESKPARTY